jgi:hypothetical protein
MLAEASRMAESIDLIHSCGVRRVVSEGAGAS